MDVPCSCPVHGILYGSRTNQRNWGSAALPLRPPAVPEVMLSAVRRTTTPPCLMQRATTPQSRRARGGRPCPHRVHPPPGQRRHIARSVHATARHVSTGLCECPEQENEEMFCGSRTIFFVGPRPRGPKNHLRGFGGSMSPHHATLAINRGGGQTARLSLSHTATSTGAGAPPTIEWVHIRDGGVSCGRPPI